MIERIDGIKNFGIYKDFTFDAPDFKKYNLMYGWNYSGKTTLSRIFRCIELEELHMDFPDAEFELTDNEGNKIKHNKLNVSTYQFRIFNTDFVNHNLYWDAQEANPIFILGEEDIESQKQIEILNETIANLEKEKETITHEKSCQENDLETKLTNKARELNRIKSPYNRTKLKKTLDDSRASLEEQCLSEKVLVTLHETVTTSSKAKLSDISFKTLDQKRVNEIKEILDKTVISQTIERLKSNPELNNWVQKGFDLHKEKMQCEFCGNQLTNDLLSAYEKHFSKEYENILIELNRQIQGLKGSQISIQTLDEKRLHPQLEDEYKIVKSKLNKSISEYNEIIEKISNLLNKKISNPFKKYADDLPFIDVNYIIENTNEFNKLLDMHNDICDNFENKQLEAFDKLELHYAYEFNNENDYFGTLDRLQQLSNKTNLIINNIKKNADVVHEIESQLSNVGKAADKINHDLQSIFGREHIKLEAFEDNKFRISRDGREAKNLSEGEKTAIAFSYFLTRLEDQETDLSKAIVFIDDPISSLDSNHLYNTFAVIKANLENCNQLFISTHNHEFFNLMKDWFAGMKKNKCCYYLIERITRDEKETSDISELPSFLLKYKSEYHYLFYKIKSFHTNSTTEFESLYQLPNIIRRFLEAFIGFKYSSGLKKGLDILISDESDRIKVDKFVNNFSHQGGLSRSLVFADVNECNNIVEIVLEAVKKKDGEHYDVLEGIYNGVDDR